jgi:hypothetical protein
MAVYDLSKSSALKTALDSFGNEMKTAIGTSSYKTKIATIRNNTQGYSYQEHADLQHFVTQIKNDSTLSTSLKNAASALLTQITTFRVYEKHQSSTGLFGMWDFSHTNATGLAIFFPRGFTCCAAFGTEYSLNSSGYCQQSGSTSQYYSLSNETCQDEDNNGGYNKSEPSKWRNEWSSGWKNFLSSYY